MNSDILFHLEKYDLLDIAWASGILEGEGCFHICKDKRIHITVAMVDRDIIYKLHTIFSFGHISNRILPSKKTLYIWKITKRKDALELCHLILPFMGERRSKKIEEILTN